MKVKIPPNYFFKKNFKVHENCQNSNPAEKFSLTSREDQEVLIFCRCAWGVEGVIMWFWGHLDLFLRSPFLSKVKMPPRYFHFIRETKIQNRKYFFEVSRPTLFEWSPPIWIIGAQNVSWGVWLSHPVAIDWLSDLEVWVGH